jgi:hypothetical protein
MKQTNNFNAILIFVLAILSILTSFFIDISTTFCLLIFYIMGISVLRLRNHLLLSKEIKIYSILFLTGYLYILVSYIYMQINNYNYLLILDTAKTFYPNTKDYLSHGNIVKSFNEIWNNFTLFKRSNAGYYSILTIFGYISMLIGSELYVSLQIGTLFLTSFTGILIYKISLKSNIDISNSFRNTLYICLCSYFFFYSTLILRDSIIALLFLLICSVFFSSNKFINVILIFLLSLSIMFLRVESGLFAFLFIPLYVVHIFKKVSKMLKLYYAFLLFSVLFTIFIVVKDNLEIFFTVYNNNQDNYIADVEEGSGIIGSLQKLPPIISDALSVVYTAIQPIPFWTKLSTSSYYSIPECYNIMAFPTAVAGFFNFASLFYIIRAIIMKHININRTFKLLLFMAMLFLFLQSAVVSQRRVLFAYALLYIVASLSYINTNKNTKWQYNMFILLSYIVINIIGLFILV